MDKPETSSVSASAAVPVRGGSRLGAPHAPSSEENRIFGVPTFVYGKQLFWGQDRMQRLREAVLRTDDARG